MSNVFNIIFALNGNFLASMCVKEDMMFCEVVKNFSDCFPLKEWNEAKFFFNSNEIKSDSSRKLKDIGITNMSIIEVKTKTPINNPNIQNSMGMNSFQPMGYMGMKSFQPMGYMGMNSFQPMGYMGMNNFMGGMNEEVININFNYSGNSIPIQAKKNEPFSNISQKFCMKAGIRNNEFPTYFLGSRKINSNDNQTLSELYIHNNSEISVLLSFEVKEEVMNIIFNYEGKAINIQGTKYTKFSELSRKFCIKAGIREDTSRYRYLFRSRLIEFNENITLDQLGLCNNFKIEVILTTDIIGA